MVVLVVIVYLACMALLALLSLKKNMNILLPSATASPSLTWILTPPFWPLLSPLPSLRLPLPPPRFFSIITKRSFLLFPSADIKWVYIAALLAYAAEYGHPVIVHNCSDLVAFQAAYPLANVCPILEVSVALLQQGHSILLASKL
jgi:hypothetical protein